MSRRARGPQSDEEVGVEPVRSRCSEAGDTLIEVLLALIVLGLASLALIIAFSTTISASAEHRSLATANSLLGSVSQEALSEVGEYANLSLFTSCPTPISAYQADAPLTVPSPYTGKYSATITAVQYWNVNTMAFGTTCTTQEPEEITVTVTNIATGAIVGTNNFVVDYPLANSDSGTSTGVAAQMVFVPYSPGVDIVGAADKVAFNSQPVIKIEDNLGNVVTSDLSPVVLSIASGPPGAVLSNCSGDDVNGVVTFVGCAIDTDGTYTLMASDGSLPTITSTSFIVSGQVDSLVFTTQPVGAVSGSNLGQEPVIKVENAGGTVQSWSGTISITSSGGILGGGCATNIAVTNGVSAVLTGATACTFEGGIFYNSVSGESLSTQYTMTASVVTGTTLISGTSQAFGVTAPGPATRLIFAQEPDGAASTSPTTPFTIQPIVDLEDAFGNIATTTNGTVKMTISSGQTLGGCANVVANDGAAAFTACAGSAYGTVITLTASSTGLSSATSTPFSITGVPAYLVFTQQPIAGDSGTTFTTQPVVTIYDSGGRVVTAETAAIVPSASGGSLTLCSGLTPVSGVVNLTTCTFAGVVGTSYTMTATLGTISVQSNPFSVAGPGVATQLAFTTQPVAGASQSAFTVQPVVKIEDSEGNIVTSSGATISNPPATSGGTLASCANLTAITGVIDIDDCTFAGVVSTNYTMTVSSTGLLSATSANFSPTAAGPASQVNLSGCSTNIVWPASCSATAILQDEYHNTILTYNSGLTFGQTGGTGSVSGLGNVNATSGVSTITVTANTVGTAVIQAVGDGFTSNGLTITVIGAPQSVAFYSGSSFTPPAIATGTTTFSPTGTYQLWAEGSGSGIVTYASSTPSFCSVNASSGLVSTVGAGTCSLTADAAGTNHYADSGTTRFALTINQALNAITVTSTAPTSATVGGTTYTPIATATSGDAVLITSATPSVCSISGSVVSYAALGTCTLDFNDPGNANYLAANPAPIVQSFNVAKGLPSNIVTNSATPALGGSVIFTATVSAPTGGVTPTGGVSWNVSGTSTVTACTTKTVTLSGTGGQATATCTITASNAGTYIVSDTYAGDTNYSAVTSATDMVTVAPVTPTNVVTNSSPTFFGGSVTFTTTVTGPAGGPTPTGAITWNVSGTSSITACTTKTVTLSGSGNQATASCTITVSKSGTYNVSDVYAGDSNYVNVTAATSTMKGTPAVVVTNNAVSTGGTLVFTATVSGPPGGTTPTGAITWTISGGAAACTSPTGPTGTTNAVSYSCSIVQAKGASTYSATASYPGDTNYAVASGSDNNASVATYTPVIAVSNNTVSLGGTLTFTAKVTGPAGGPTPTGTMGWAITGTGSSCTPAGPSGAANVATYTCSITGVGAGTYNATAAYPGDGNYGAVAGSDNAVGVAKVTPASNVVTNTAAPAVGGSVTFTATVTGPAGGPTPSSTVIWSVSGGAGSTGCSTSTVTLSGSSNKATATCTISNVSKVGTIIVSDAYGGDSNYNAITSPADTVTSTKYTPSNLVTSGTTPAVGGSVTFTATVTALAGDATPSGNVTWTTTGGTAGFTACASPSALSGSGNTATATCTLTGVTKVGTIKVSDAYAGDVNYGAVTSATDSISSNQATPVVVVSNNAVSTGQSLVFTATVTGPSSGITPTGTLTWTVSGGAATCTKAGPSGTGNVATYTCTIASGSVFAADTYSATATYPGDTDYFGASSGDNGAMVSPGTQAALTVTSTSGTDLTPLALTDSGGSGTGADTYTVANGTASGCTRAGTAPNFTLSASTPGTCLVTATSAADVNYNQISSAQTTVTMFGEKPWYGTNTNSTTVTSQSFSAPSTESVLIVVWYEASSSVTCGLPSGGALNTYVTVDAPPAWYSTSGSFRMCAFAGQGTGASSGITETFSGTVVNSVIAAIEVTGDDSNNGAKFTAASQTTGSSATQTYRLSAAPAAGNAEFLMGDLTNGTTSPPSWNAISGYDEIGLATEGSGSLTWAPVAYFGTPAALSTTGTTTATASFGTIGIEVTP